MSAGIGVCDFCLPEEPELANCDILWEALEEASCFQLPFEKAFQAHKEKRYQAAVDGYTTLLKKGDDKPAVWQNLCHAHSTLGNTEETERLLARMRVKFPYYLHIQIDAARVNPHAPQLPRAYYLLKLYQAF